MSAVAPLDLSPSSVSVRPAFERLKAGWRAHQGLSYAERMAYLDRLLHALSSYRKRIGDAVDQDFGCRSRHETDLFEMFPSIQAIKYIRSHLRAWMRPEARETSLVFIPGKNRLIYQPLGVVGIIAPWNYPINLAIIPLAYAIAAGNRVLLKPSELAPKTAEVLAALIEEIYPPDVAAVVTGGPEVGIAFSQLPFDHLLFTGSTTVGRHVMRAAAENLVPVTLELGGKSPTIIHPDYPLDKAVERIVVGKLVNAGQMCVAPDYLLIHQDQLQAFEASFQAAVARLYPRLADNPDYTAIISERHYRRVSGLVEDARQRGARVVEVNPAGETFAAEARKIPPTLLFDVPAGAGILEEEIFGPLLPVISYQRLEDAIAHVNANPRPLALYYFDYDRERVRKVLSETTSGGATINDTFLHFGQEALPVGGVGPSGMGSYHGKEGFTNFSHKKGVFFQARVSSIGLLKPPYGGRFDRLMGLFLGRRK